MENPATWGEAEKIIRKVVQEDLIAHHQGRIGWSLEKKIAEALREAGLLSEGI